MTTPSPLHLSFVCTGNICRSPMGEVVFRRMVEEAGIGDRFVITSRGMGDWHVGNQADPRTLTALARRGYDGEQHRAAQLSDADIAGNELLVALDRGHKELMLERGADPDRVVLLTEFDPEQPDDPDVFDPYWSDDDAFDRVLEQVERSCRVLLERLRGEN
ncbi:low molecular weight phosphotyrosine protein phosphatase [Leucobacter viscericola]|uniref:protein-tyrosine-phosphatase n=1 Tax=Leucobacter viscericola TaxID=2714935 RepID=A0A6G7XFN1_9MICO|nr:low molecular weight protein-tyrosine-phosphatase [Leucobacter viscericola]QIK63420.1 low molecular weight phosphotyrosine protein phosphatase [Leucobacter viscericola]